MIDLPTPRATRLERPSWRDTRLIVGILLVLLSATLGAKAISSADDRVPRYVAAVDAAAGDEITDGTFRRVDVRLDDAMAAYLQADRPAPVGSFLLTDLRAGQLVPDSAVGDAADVTTQRVTVQVDTTSATGLDRGSVVDVFVSAVPEGAPSSSRPDVSKALERISVAAVLTGGGTFGSRSSTSVQLQVPVDEVAALVEAVDGGSKLTLVPVPGSLSAVDRS